MELKIILRWLIVVALLAAAGVVQARFGNMVSFAIKLPYDAPGKTHDSLVAAIEIALAVILYFAGIILILFNVHWHRRARKAS